MQAYSLRVRRIDAQTNRPSRGDIWKANNGNEKAAASAVQGKIYFLPLMRKHSKWMKYNLNAGLFIESETDRRTNE